MRLVISVFGKELFAVDAGQDEGLRQLASVLAEVLASRPAPAGEPAEDVPEATGTADASVIERDHRPFDPNANWRWDSDSPPEYGRPLACDDGGFGFR